MKSLLSLLAALATVAATHTEARVTQKCNATQANVVFLMGMPSSSVDRVLAATPSGDASLFSSLWEPRSIARDGAGSVELRLNPMLDIDEVIAKMKSDPLIASLGAQRILPWGTAAVGIIPPSQFFTFVPVPVTEYHDTVHDHYYLASGRDETTFLDAGGAGPGWVRTGQVFNAGAGGAFIAFPDGVPVYQFYLPGFKSFFYTSDPAECGALLKPQSGWLPAGLVFATFPEAGKPPSACDRGFLPLWRFYNNRGLLGDPNHRYTASPTIRAEMTAAGWTDEGVRMCVLPPNYTIY